VVSSIGEKNSKPDKGKLSCLHAHGLVSPISAVDKEKKITRMASPLPSQIFQGVLGRGVTPPKKIVQKKNGGSMFSSFVGGGGGG